MESCTETNTAEQVTPEAKPADETVKTTGEVKTEEIKTEETKTEETKDGEAKDEETKTGNAEIEKPTEQLLEKIRSQVEFYFGDINLQRDKFLIEQIKLDEGWIPMTVMLKFQLLASMSKDPEVILKALESSDLIEISEGRTKIRRSPSHPLPVFDEAYRKSQAERTVYVKGFPLENIYIQKLKGFFKDEPFENIILRKYMDKQNKLRFKGSIFIQFKTLEAAKAFIARESVKYGDTELIRRFSEDYAVEKAKEKEEKKQKRGERKEKKTDENEHDSEPDAEETGAKLDLPKGSIVHFTGTSKKTTRELIKKSVTELGAEVAYIDYQMGQPEGWIRLQEANAGKTLVDKMTDSKLKVDEDELTFRALEGEEEEKYLVVVEQTIKNLRSRNKNSKRNHGKRGRNTQRGRKRHGSPARGAVSAKRNAAE